MLQKKKKHLKDNRDNSLRWARKKGQIFFFWHYLSLKPDSFFSSYALGKQESSNAHVRLLNIFQLKMENIQEVLPNFQVNVRFGKIFEGQ